MSNSSLPKLNDVLVVLFPQSPLQDDASLAVIKSTRFYGVLRTNAANSLQDMHQNRIKNMRKELDFLKETKWKYESIDKYIGQSSN